MIIAKYNRAKGGGDSNVYGATAVSGGIGGTTLDITPLTEKLAVLESTVSKLQQGLAKVQNTVMGLDGKYLSKLGDNSEGSYTLGAVYTAFLQGGLFDNGVGFRISGNDTAAVEEKYKMIIRDVGWGVVPFTTVNEAETTIVNQATDEDTAHLNVASVSIGAAASAGYILLDCGAQLTNERCFSTIAKRVEYQATVTRGNQIFVGERTEAEVDGNGRFILHFQRGDDVSLAIHYSFTYSFRPVGDVTSGTYRLYIRGTDYAHSRTDCFAAAANTGTLSAGAVTIISGNNGARLTSTGVQRTTDGGNTWT